MASRFDTHEVINQPPPLAGYNVFDSDAALAEAIRGPLEEMMKKE